MMPPENHYGLETKQKLLETLQQEVTVYEAKFAPLQEQFNLLDKYEKPVPDSVSFLIRYFNRDFMIWFLFNLDASYAFRVR